MTAPLVTVVYRQQVQLVPQPCRVQSIEPPICVRSRQEAEGCVKRAKHDCQHQVTCPCGACWPAESCCCCTSPMTALPAIKFSNVNLQNHEPPTPYYPTIYQERCQLATQVQSHKHTRMPKSMCPRAQYYSMHKPPNLELYPSLATKHQHYT